MARRRVEISVEEAFIPHVSRTLLRRAALRALDTALPNQPCHLTLALCSDSTVHRLNREYRGEDQVTDVLSFSSLHPGPWQGAEDGPAGKVVEFVLPPGTAEAPYLGDIIISHPQALRQASEAGHSPERELALLVVHGVLHLLGYDHQEPGGKATMWTRQDKALTRLFPLGSG